MELEKFKKIIETLRDASDLTDQLYKLKVDLIDFTDPYHGIIYQLMQEVYDENGVDWWSWFCYEKDFGRGEVEAWDKDGNKICYDIESLHSMLEKEYKRTK